MNGFFTQAGIYIVSVIFELFIFAVLLRLLFQLTRADFYNPVAQFVVALTNPVLRPLRRVIPGLFGVDIASIVLLFILKGAEISLIAALRGVPIPPSMVAIATLAELIMLTLRIFFFAVIIRAILSWIVPYGGRQNPMMSPLISITEPLMRPARRLIPPFNGIDLSPIAVIVVLQLGIMLVQQLGLAW